MTVAKIVRLFKDKRAVNAVISNLILIAAVIVVGFAVLYWTQYQSSVYNAQYSDIVRSDISQLQERLALEYTYYNSPTLKVYLLNPGAINVTIQTVYVGAVSFSFTVKDFAGNTISSRTLGTAPGTREAYIEISPITLAAGGTYSIKIVTARGSSFVYSFAT